MYIRMIPLLLTTVLTVLTYKSPWGTTGIERLFFSEANGWICTPSESFSSPRSKLEHFSLEQSNTDVHIYLRPICVPSILVFVLLWTSGYGPAERVLTTTLLYCVHANYCMLSFAHAQSIRTSLYRHKILPQHGQSVLTVQIAKSAPSTQCRDCRRVVSAEVYHTRVSESEIYQTLNC